MSGSAPRKFGFDTEFGATAEPGFVAPRYKRLYTSDEAAHLRESAYAEGRAAALAEIAAEQARALSAVAEACAAALPKLAGVAHSHREGSAALAMACARAIADAALLRFPHAPLQSAIEVLAREIEAAPRLVVTVAPELAEGVAGPLAETAQAIGYAGAIQVRPGPGLPASAFTLDFGDGSASFDPQSAAARVAAALDAALAAEGLHAEPLIPGSES